MSNYALGHKALLSFCLAQNPMAWHKAKLTKAMFKPQEQPAFEWVDGFVRKHHALPKIETLVSAFPMVGDVTAPEPPSYYAEHLENRYFNELISEANLASQNILKEDPKAIDKALQVIKEASKAIAVQRYRARIVDLAQDGPSMVMTAYQNTLLVEKVAEFGWAYLDGLTGGLMGGDIVSFVGRPAAGKTFKMLYTAMHNWKLGRNVLFVSMEMAPLPIIQRATALYAHTNLTQLKQGAYSTHAAPGQTSTFSKFVQGLKELATEKAKFWVVDGNLAASPEDIYELALQLGADLVFIDGAYLMKNKNPRLDRFTRVAENSETMKLCTSDLEIPTFASWQFNREASKKKDVKQTGGLEDIAYSDAIGQISTVALGLFQEDTVETLYQRVIKVLKGRNGEIGEFKIHWDFMTMNFSQVVEEVGSQPPELENL